MLDNPYHNWFHVFDVTQTTFHPTPSTLHPQPYISQSTHKSANLSFIITNIKDTLMDLCANLLLQNDVINALCAMLDNPYHNWFHVFDVTQTTFHPTPSTLIPQP